MRKGQGMKYEIVVVWSTGEKQIFGYATREEAEQAKAGYEMAFGSQVWVCVRERRMSND